MSRRECKSESIYTMIYKSTINYFQINFQDYKSTLTEFEEKMPLLQAEITFHDQYLGFYLNPRKKMNKLFPFTRFIRFR